MSVQQQQFDFLLSRLLWPSGMVKERACDAAARLLIDKDLSSAAISALLDWLSGQKLESTAAIALLVLYRARTLKPDWPLPAIDDVTTALRKPSLLSNLLLIELYGDRIVDDLQGWYTELASVDYESDPFFLKCVQGLLPLIYSDWADRITRLGIAFWQQWAYEWEHLVAETGVKKTSGAMDFHGQQHYDHYTVFDVRMSEVYRSAFLRALACAAHRSALGLDDAYYLAAKTCELDLGIWLIEPGVKPIWWPNASSPEGEIDTVPAQVWQQVENLWNKEREMFGDKALIQAGGRVYEDKVVYDLEILGAFQRCEGNAQPSADAAVEWYTESPYLTYEPDTITRLGGKVARRDVQIFEKKLGDWLVTPAARVVHPITFPRWEYWKEYRGIWVPLPYLELRISCSTSGVAVSDGSVEIAKWQVWTNGLREKEPGMLSSPQTGEFVMAERKVVNGLAVELGSVFCWICRLIGHHREYDGTEWKTFTDCKMFGTTSIIRPSF